MADLSKKYNPQNSSAEARPTQLVNLGNITKSNNLPLLGSSGDMAKADAAQGVDNPVAESH